MLADVCPLSVHVLERADERELFAVANEIRDASQTRHDSDPASNVSAGQLQQFPARIASEGQSQQIHGKMASSKLPERPICMLGKRCRTVRAKWEADMAANTLLGLPAPPSPRTGAKYSKPEVLKNRRKGFVNGLFVCDTPAVDGTSCVDEIKKTGRRGDLDLKVIVQEAIDEGMKLIPVSEPVVQHMLEKKTVDEQVGACATPYARGGVCMHGMRDVSNMFPICFQYVSNFFPIRFQICIGEFACT